MKIIFFSDFRIVGIKTEGSHTTGNDYAEEKQGTFRKCKKDGPSPGRGWQELTDTFLFYFSSSSSLVTPTHPALCKRMYSLPLLLPPISNESSLPLWCIFSPSLPPTSVLPFLLHYSWLDLLFFPHPLISLTISLSQMRLFLSWFLFHISLSFWQRFQVKCVSRNTTQEMCRLKREEKTKKEFFKLKPTLGAEQGKNELSRIVFSVIYLGTWCDKECDMNKEELRILVLYAPQKNSRQKSLFRWTKGTWKNVQHH